MKVTSVFVTMLSHVTYLISDITAQSCSVAELSVCSCSGTTVNCNNQGLTAVPANIPSTTTQIQLKNNNITTIDDSSFAGLTSLVRLDLDNNHVSTISTNAFRDLTSLNTISLRSNYLTSLNEGLFATNTAMKNFFLSNNNFATLSEQVFPQITGLQFIDLSGNPLLCCTLSTFLAWAGNLTGLGIRVNCVDNSPAVSHAVFDSSNCSVAVNGQWGDWTNSSCSVTCGDGTITRERACNNPSPSNGGLDCVGESSGTITCSQDDCVETGSTSDISELTPLIIGLVVGLTFVSGILALVTILLVKYTSPKVSDINLNNNNDIRKIKA